MEKISISVDECHLDFDLASQLSQTIAAQKDEDPMLICWNDKARDMHSPSGVLCQFKDTPGWEVYGENHGGRWRISVNDDEYVFIYG